MLFRRSLMARRSTSEAFATAKVQYDEIDVETLNVRTIYDGKIAVVNGAILVTLPNQPAGTANLAYPKYVVAGERQEKRLASSAVPIAEISRPGNFRAL